MNIFIVVHCCFAKIRVGVQLDEPPKPYYGFQNDIHHQERSNEIKIAVQSWSEASDDNVWERSGYYEV